MLSSNLKMISIPLVILAATSGSVGALLTATKTIDNRVEVLGIGIGVYWDIFGRYSVEFLDWGTLSPGKNRTFPLFVKNPGGVPINGSIHTEGFDPPEAEAFLIVTWNFGSVALDPGRVRQVNFTLTVSPDIRDIEKIAFLIVVTGTEWPPGPE